MPFNMLLFPLVAGYCFMHLFRVTRYRAYGLDGYRLLTESIVAGLGLLAVCQLALLGLEPYWEQASISELVARRWEAVPLVRTAGIDDSLVILGVCVVLTGAILPFLLNLGIKMMGWDGRVARFILRSYGDALTKRFIEAASREIPVSITMTTDKVYVGYVLETPSLNPKTRYVQLFPSLSGYRDKETREVKFTTNYGKAYKAVLPEIGKPGMTAVHGLADFEIVLPLEHIESANLFDARVFQHFDSASDESTAETVEES